MPPELLPFDDWYRLRIHFIRWGISSRWPRGHRPGREWFKRILIDFTLWFFFEGRGEVIDHRRGKVYSLYPGTCLCMQPGDDLEIRQFDPDSLSDLFLHIDFSDEGKALISAQWPNLPFYSEVSNVSFFDQTIRRILALLNQAHLSEQSENKEQWLAAEALMKGVLLDLIQSQQKPSLSGTLLHHERVISATLESLFADPRRYRSVSELAEASGYSPGHFRALCQRITGEVPGKLLLKARMEQAKKFLRHSELTVSMIAEALGYEHIYYFSRQFKRFTGLTASEYRKRSLPKGEE